MQYRQVKALVIGDIMLDRFVYGNVQRISPEAPIPVLAFSREKAMLGGAGNVLRNVMSLGAVGMLISVVGDDEPGRLVLNLMQQDKSRSRLLVAAKRPTTVKTRYIAGTNHILRVDSETKQPIDESMQKKMLSAVKSCLPKADIILLSDYGKGLLSRDGCQKIINLAKSAGKKVIVDPKGTDYSKYHGASIVKPNLKEFCETTAERHDPGTDEFEQGITRAAKRLCRKFDLGGVLVTLSEYGMIYVPNNRGPVIRIPTVARDVYDVSGAGDTSLAALGISLAEGKGIKEAMLFANAAAGIAVSKLGTANVLRDEVESSVKQENDFTMKILSRTKLAAKIELLKRDGKRIGFTNGCFDCCHRGHLKSLRDARSLCDVLVVGINSDTWIKAHKGDGRPIQDVATRAELLASLSCVDFVTVFDEETALPLVKELKPHVIAKEGYELSQWPEGRYVKSIGGEAIVLKRVNGYSTTAIVNRIKG